MGDKPFIPFYTSDFLAGTGGMTAATKGVYITLLSLMYEAEKPLPQSMDALARRCGSTKSAFEKAVQILVEDGKLVVSDKGIWSPKCDKHIEARRRRGDSARAASKKRWEKTKQKQGAVDAIADANAMRPICHPEPEPYNTLPIGSDGDAVDFTKEVFDLGVAFLGKHGINERQARSLIGKWRKDSGDDKTYNALRDVSKQSVTEPVAWITARLKAKPAAEPIEFDLNDFKEDLCQ